MILEQITERIEKMKIGETVDLKGYRVYKSTRGYKVTQGNTITYYQRGSTVARVLNEAINVKVMKPQVKPQRVRKERQVGSGKAITAMTMLIVELIAVALYAFATVNLYALPELNGFLEGNLPYILLGIAFVFGLVASVTSGKRVGRIVMIVNAVLLVSLLGWVGQALQAEIPAIPNDQMLSYLVESPLFEMVVVTIVVLLSRLLKPRKREV